MVQDRAQVEEKGCRMRPMGEATNSKFLQGVGFNPFQERGNNIVTYEWVSQADP